LITAGDIGTLKSNSKWLVPGHIFIVTVIVMQQSVSHCNSLVMSMYSEIQLLPLGVCACGCKHYMRGLPKYMALEYFWLVFAQRVRLLSIGKLWPNCHLITINQ